MNGPQTKYPPGYYYVLWVGQFLGEVFPPPPMSAVGGGWFQLPDCGYRGREGMNGGGGGRGATFNGYGRRVCKVCYVNICAKGPLRAGW